MPKRVAFVLNVLLIGLIAASCGGDSEQETTITSASDLAGSTVDDSGTDGDEDTTTTEASEATSTSEIERVVCQVPEPTLIVLGDSVEGEVLGWDECFTVDVPAGASELTVALTGLQDELNLVVAYADPEILRTYVGDLWESREDGLADESITIENPQPGTYYINVAVATYRNESPFTLTATP